MNFSPDGPLVGGNQCRCANLYLGRLCIEETAITGQRADQRGQGQTLAGTGHADATKAFQAVRELIARPDEAVSLLQAGWKRVPRATTEQMQKWIEDLDSNQSSVREKAQAELDLHLAGHEQLLSKALAKSTLEQRNRLAEILNRLHPGQLQRTRMLEVLERIGSGPSRQFLQTLAGQTDDVETSREATAGLERLKR